MKSYEEYLQDNERKAVALLTFRAKSRLGKNLIDMKIFGSKVRGDFDEESDIDILIVVKKRDTRVRDSISEIASDLNLEFDCLLSPVIYTKEEYNRNRYFKNLFSENIATEGVTL